MGREVNQSTQTATPALPGQTGTPNENPNAGTVTKAPGRSNPDIVGGGTKTGY